MVIAGAKLAMGSWKIIDTEPPLTVLSSLPPLSASTSTDSPSTSSKIFVSEL